MHHADLGGSREPWPRRRATIRPEWVFHLAATAPTRRRPMRDRMVTTNIVGPSIWSKPACAPASRPSSTPDHRRSTASRTTRRRDRAARAQQPLRRDQSLGHRSYCRLIAQTRRGIHMPTLRLYSVYGPYEEPTRLMPTLIVHGLARGCHRWSIRRSPATSSSSTTSATPICLAAHNTDLRSRRHLQRRHRRANVPARPGGHGAHASCRSRQNRCGVRCRTGSGTPRSGSPTAARSTMSSAGIRVTASSRDSAAWSNGFEITVRH